MGMTAYKCAPRNQIRRITLLNVEFDPREIIKGLLDALKP